MDAFHFIDFFVSGEQLISLSDFEKNQQNESSYSFFNFNVLTELQRLVRNRLKVISIPSVPKDADSSPLGLFRIAVVGVEPTIISLWG